MNCYNQYLHVSLHIFTFLDFSALRHSLCTLSVCKIWVITEITLFMCHFANEACSFLHYWKIALKGQTEPECWQEQCNMWKQEHGTKK